MLYTLAVASLLICHNSTVESYGLLANCHTRTSIRISLFADRDLCQSQPCLNGGTCSDRDNTIVCLCPADYSGELCDEAESKQGIIV